MADTLESIWLLEEQLDLPKNFYRSLMKEDDWSFIIKLHALLESALSDLVTHALGRPQLAEIFSIIEMSNQRTGKLAFAKALELLESDHRRFINGLSELRNHLVHRIKNVAFNLRNHFDGLSAEHRKGFVKVFGCGVKESGIINGRPFTRAQFVEDTPKLAIWFAGLVTLDIISFKRRFSPTEAMSDDQNPALTPEAVDQLLSDAKMLAFPSNPERAS